MKTKRKKRRVLRGWVLSPEHLKPLFRSWIMIAQEPVTGIGFRKCKVTVEWEE